MSNPKNTTNDAGAALDRVMNAIAELYAIQLSALTAEQARHACSLVEQGAKVIYTIKMPGPFEMTCVLVHDKIIYPISTITDDSGKRLAFVENDCPVN